MIEWVGRWKDNKTLELQEFSAAGGEPRRHVQLPADRRHLIWEGSRTAARVDDFTAFDNSLRRLIPAA
jgi:hypothetical protein